VLLEGAPSQGVLFSDNVIVDAESDHKELKDSQIGNILERK